MILTWDNQSTQRRFLLLLCLQQIPCQLAWVPTVASVVRGQRLIAKVMAWPKIDYDCFLQNPFLITIFEYVSHLIYCL